MNDCARIYSLLICCWIIGCRDADRLDTDSMVARISGSSMEPTLKGAQRIGFCETCQERPSFSAESVLENSPVRCPRCGDRVLWEGWQNGEQVNVAQFPGADKSIRRGELVVLRESNTDKLEVKRIVGLPNELLKFTGGDLWVDGRLFQKSITQFLSQAIEVERWPAIEGDHQSLPNEPPIVKGFHYLSLWPQSSEMLRAHPSPIRDEYRCNAAESRRFIPVRDIGIKLALSENEVHRSRIEFQIWVDDAARRFQIVLSDRGIEKLIDRTLHSVLPRNTSAFIPWGSHRPRTLVVAMVDGRLLIGTDRRTHSVNLSELIDNPNSIDSNRCSAETPITLALIEGRLSIMQAIVIRDVHYRGSNGEVEFTLQSTKGYHVLGDNVSNSADSRERWPDGIPADWILGRIKHR